MVLVAARAQHRIGREACPLRGHLAGSLRESFTVIHRTPMMTARHPPRAARIRAGTLARAPRMNAMDRRMMLKTGVGAAALLAGGGLAGWLAGRDARADRRDVLAGLVPGMLGSALPAEPGARLAAIEQCIDGVEIAIAGLAPASQDELDQLFTLLSIAPGRVLLAGTAQAWREMPPKKAEAVLSSWRTHPIELMQVSYHALHDLVYGAWYGTESHWQAIGYGGPLNL